MINPEHLTALPDDVLKAFGAFADTVDCGSFQCEKCPYRLDKKQMHLMYKNIPRLAGINCSFVLCKRIAL